MKKNHMLVLLALLLGTAVASTPRFEPQRSRQEQTFEIGPDDHSIMFYNQSRDDWSEDNPFDHMQEARGSCSPSCECEEGCRVACCYPCPVGSGRCPDANPPDGVACRRSDRFNFTAGCFQGFQIRGYHRPTYLWYLLGELNSEAPRGRPQDAEEDIDWLMVDISAGSIDVQSGETTLESFEHRALLNTPTCETYEEMFPYLALLAPTTAVAGCVDLENDPDPCDFEVPDPEDIPFTMPSGYTAIIVQGELPESGDHCDRHRNNPNIPSDYEFYDDHPTIHVEVTEPGVYYWVVWDDSIDEDIKDYSLILGPDEGVQTFSDIDVGQFEALNDIVNNGASISIECNEPDC